MAEMNGYVAMLKGRRIEIRAESLYAAKLEAAKQLKATKRQLGLLSVMLAEKAGQPVTHIAVD